jgi:predicted TIM-barrel fold metal-dependent hydrolase
MADGLATIYPEQQLGAPLQRKPQREPALARDTLVVSADNHMSLSEDIWFERFPASMKDRAPRVWKIPGGFQIGAKDKPLLPPQFRLAFDQFEDLPGCSSANIEARMADLAAEGVDKEVVFANGAQVLFGYPDLEARDLCFRIYNEYLAELQARAPGKFYGVGFVNWWDAKGTRRSLQEMKALGIRTFLLPTKASGLPGAPAIDWTSTEMIPIWEEIEDAGLPVAHHIGEAPQLTEYNFLPIGFVYNAGTFREMFAKYISGGILDRHPQLKVGWYEAGVSWILPVLQDAEHAHASYRQSCNWEVRRSFRDYWRDNMFASFIVDPLGLEQIDRLGAERILWSADYPHIESSFGYTRSSLNAVFDALDEAAAKRVVGGNVVRLLGLD